MKQKVLNLIYIIVGNILIALAVNTLILENHIIVGGTSGIGNVFNYYFHICEFLVLLLFTSKI